MSQARRSTGRRNLSNQGPIKHGLREILLIFFCFMGLYLFVSLLTYHHTDPGWGHSGQVAEVGNKGGIAGALFADILYNLFGYLSFFFPFMVGYIGWIIYQDRHREILEDPHSLIIPSIGFILTLSAGCGLAVVHFADVGQLLIKSYTGGILGVAVGSGLQMVFSKLGATLLLIALFFTGITLLTGLSWLKVMDALGYHTLQFLPVAKEYIVRKILPSFKSHGKTGIVTLKDGFIHMLRSIGWWFKDRWSAWRERRSVQRREDEYDDYYDDEYDDESPDNTDRPKSSPEIETSEVKPAIAIETPDMGLSPQPTGRIIPALNLLNQPASPQAVNVAELTQRIIDAFGTLHLQINVKAVHPGPVLSGFEVQPVTPLGLPLDEVSTHLAQVLNVNRVRIIETMPNVLGVEIPNVQRQTIYLSELLTSHEYQENPSPLSIALGKNVLGQPVIIDLARIPHILLCGHHPVEKTTAIHTVILSLLYKSTPEDVRLILLDSTTQALSLYADLPHLLTPIATEAAKSLTILQWCVNEMERRYRLMADVGVRNIEGYNGFLHSEEGQSFRETNKQAEVLFYLIVIVQELSELITTENGAKTEEFIVLLTQKARAAGIHLVLATQYPSANVITSLLKSNIPARMAFQVATKSESRIILGQMGAETLLGEGDMFYMTTGTGVPVRIHGSTVSSIEVERVVTDLKRQGQPDYIDI